MLNDHERKTLRAVEHDFRVEDPAFARIFEARQTSLSRNTRRLDASIVVAVVMLLVVLMVAAGSAVGAMGLIVATGLFWVGVAPLWRRQVTGSVGARRFRPGQRAWNTAVDSAVLASIS